MKAEERKENETNSLRVWVDHMRERFQGRALYFVVGSLLLIMAVFFGVRFWLISREAADSRRIYEFTTADTDKKLDEITNAEDNQGKPVAVWAKLEKARLILYREGFDRLGAMTQEDRDKAVSKVEEGRKRYSEIANDLKDEALQQEADFSQARAEEVLAGVPKADKATEYRGSIDKAIEFYRKAAAINPNSDISKKYANDADRLKNKKDAIEKFYHELNLQGFTAPLNKPLGP